MYVSIARKAICIYHWRVEEPQDPCPHWLIALLESRHAVAGGVLQPPRASQQEAMNRDVVS